MKKKMIVIISIIIFCIFFMGIVDGIIQPNYFYKSVVKAIIFLGLPLAYLIISKDKFIFGVFRINLKEIIISISFGMIIYFIIILAYFLFRNVFDFSNITTSLSKSIDVTSDNFIIIAIYISFVNSLLEEFFFRGFSFLIFKKYTSKRFAYFFSSTFFSFYHVAMMIGWFGIPVYLLVMLGLFIGAMIFNFIDDKLQSIYPSWFVHMFANFAINTIGLILFGIL